MTYFCMSHEFINLRSGAISRDGAIHWIWGYLGLKAHTHQLYSVFFNQRHNKSELNWATNIAHHTHRHGWWSRWDLKHDSCWRRQISTAIRKWEKLKPKRMKGLVYSSYPSPTPSSSIDSHWLIECWSNRKIIFCSLFRNPTIIIKDRYRVKSSQVKFNLIIPLGEI